MRREQLRAYAHGMLAGSMLAYIVAHTELTPAEAAARLVERVREGAGVLLGAEAVREAERVTRDAAWRGRPE